MSKRRHFSTESGRPKCMFLTKELEGVNVAAIMPFAQNLQSNRILFRHQRRAPRGFAVLPLAVSAAGQDHVGLLRDISNTGMFFYSKVILTIGSEIHLVVNVSSVDPELTVRCKCRVVRVDPGLAGAATGVGVTIEGYEKT